MGFFSWKCAVSGESLAVSASGKELEQKQAYLVTPTETYFEQYYEGYGEFGEVDVYELLGDGDRDKGINAVYDEDKTPKFDIKIVLAKHYTGQTYDQLPKSEDCPYQGYFFEEEIQW